MTLAQKGISEVHCGKAARITSKELCAVRQTQGQLLTGPSGALVDDEGEMRASFCSRGSQYLAEKR